MICLGDLRIQIIFTQMNQSVHKFLCMQNTIWVHVTYMVISVHAICEGLKCSDHWIRLCGISSLHCIRSHLYHCNRKLSWSFNFRKLCTDVSMSSFKSQAKYYGICINTFYILYLYIEWFRLDCYFFLLSQYIFIESFVRSCIWINRPK